MLSFERAIVQYVFLLGLLCPAVAQVYARQSSSTFENLRGLSAPSAKTAWASGTHGTYLKTIDGGASWQSFQVPGAASLDFRALSAFDADVAVLLSAGPGDQSRIYKTKDGGKTWQLRFTNQEPTGFFDCLAFWDRDHGIVLGDPVKGSFRLLTTADGGDSWHPVRDRALPPAIAGEAAFAASGSCITVQGKGNAWFATGGKVARVFRSRDRARTWQVANTPIEHGEDTLGIFSIAFRDARHGAIAGGDYKHPDSARVNLAFTDDGGVSWRAAWATPPFFVSAIAFASNGRLLVAGPTHAAYAEDWRKPTWSKDWSLLGLNSVQFSSETTALAVGAKGIVVEFSILP
jgi:photosystem II stability/assembly factor-like uncharacterized protein